MQSSLRQRQTQKLKDEKFIMKIIEKILEKIIKEFSKSIQCYWGWRNTVYD